MNVSGASTTFKGVSDRLIELLRMARHDAADDEIPSRKIGLIVRCRCPDILGDVWSPDHAGA